MHSNLGLPRINGRRGAYLLVNAPVYLVVGISFLLPQTDTQVRKSSLAWILDLGMPIQALAVLWIMAALVAMVTAFQPRPRDWFGFAILTFAAAILGALFFIGTLLGGPAIGAVSAVVYWFFAASPMVVAGMMGDTDRDYRKVVL